MSPGARHALHEALLWGAVIFAGIAGIVFFDDITNTVQLSGDTAASPEAAAEGSAELPSDVSSEVRLKADARGHFIVQAYVNGRKATFVVDTGATLVVLSYEEAERLGLSPRNLDFWARVETANGIAAVAPVTLDRMRVQGITVRDVKAVVAQRGALTGNLLGMSFLRRLSSFQMRGSELVLEP